MPCTMDAPFLLLLLLVVSGGAAAAGDQDAGQPRLEFRGIVNSGRGHASDAPAFIEAISADSDEASRLEFGGTDDPGRAHASDAPEEPSFIEDISADGACGRFARLVAEKGNAGQIFLERVAGGGGLTVFCPEDKALAEFEPKFRTLGADDQLVVLLYHGVAARYGREQFRAFDWVSVKTLAADAATNKSHAITVRDDGDTVRLWPSSGSGDAARVTKTVSEEPTLAVYVVDAVLLPSHLRQLLDGGDELAACTPRGGYLGWLHDCVPVWVTLLVFVGSMVGVLVGFLIALN